MPGYSRFFIFLQLGDGTSSQFVIVLTGLNLQHSSCQHAWKTVDPDQMASDEASDLNLQCFQKRINLRTSGQGFNLKKSNYSKLMSNLVKSARTDL